MTSSGLAILNSSVARTRSWLAMSCRTTARLIRSSPTTSSYWAGRICCWITLAEGGRGRYLTTRHFRSGYTWVCRWEKSEFYLPWGPAVWRRAFPRRCLRGCGCTLWPGRWYAPSSSWQLSACWWPSPWSGRAPRRPELCPGSGGRRPPWTSLLNKHEESMSMSMSMSWRLFSAEKESDYCTENAQLPLLKVELSDIVELLDEIVEVGPVMQRLKESFEWFSHLEDNIMAHIMCISCFGLILFRCL